MFCSENEPFKEVNDKFYNPFSHECDLPLPLHFLIFIGVGILLILGLLLCLCCILMFSGKKGKKMKKKRKSENNNDNNIENLCPSGQALKVSPKINSNNSVSQIISPEPSIYGVEAGITTLLNAGFTESQLVDQGVADEATKTQLYDAGYTTTQLVKAGVVSKVEEATKSQLYDAGYTNTQLVKAGVIEPSIHVQAEKDHSHPKAPPPKTSRAYDSSPIVRDFSRNTTSKKVLDDGVSKWMSPSSTAAKFDSSSVEVSVVNPPQGKITSHRSPPSVDDGISKWMTPVAPPKPASISVKGRDQSQGRQTSSPHYATEDGVSKWMKPSTHSKTSDLKYTRGTSPKNDEGVSTWMSPASSSDSSRSSSSYRETKKNITRDDGVSKWMRPK
jgi:hypothetical protein